MIKLLMFGLEVLLALGVFAFAYSQLLLPLIWKTPFFPMFRPRPKTEQEIEAVNEQLADRQLERDLASRQRELGKKK